MSEVRLIDANALIYELSSLCPIDFSDVEDYMGIKIDGEMLDKADVLYVIDNAPTIDPVKHGEWKFEPGAMDEMETVVHCNLKENAELIAKILDADVDGEVWKGEEDDFNRF